MASHRGATTEIRSPASPNPRRRPRRKCIRDSRPRRDVDWAIERYLGEAGPAVALAFVDALQGAFRQIGEPPAAGSPGHAHELDIPGLRFRKVGKFPYLVFHVETEAEVGVWRALRGARDIPVWMREPRGD